MEEEKRTNLRVGSSNFISLNPLKAYFLSSSVSDVLMIESTPVIVPAFSVMMTASPVMTTASPVMTAATSVMTTDKNKNITTIKYNHLNLPEYISFENGNAIEYLYNASGVKTQKKVTNGTTISTTNYLDGFQYLNGVLQFFPTAEGYVKQTTVNQQPTYDYVYNYTDHLGNIRLSYTKDPQTGLIEILEENHYYPFGLKHSKYAPLVGSILALDDNSGKAVMGVDPNSDVQKALLYKYKYNGKELQDELGLGWYDYQARNYDPALGRWMNIDPLAEMSRKYSPYAYALDNPVFFIDPDGMMATPPDWFVNNENGEVVYFKGESEVTQEMLNNANYDGDANSFERLGEDNMFGAELKTKEGVNILEKDFVTLGNSKEFMTSRGYSESEKVTVKESEITSGGTMGNERVPLTTSDIKQIDETKMSYSKPNELVKSHTDLKPENILKETSGSGKYSSSKSITYNLTKPVGQDIRVTAQYYSNRQMDYGKAGTFLGELGKIIRALF